MLIYLEFLCVNRNKLFLDEGESFSELLQSSNVFRGGWKIRGKGGVERIAKLRVAAKTVP